MTNGRPDGNEAPRRSGDGSSGSGDAPLERQPTLAKDVGEGSEGEVSRCRTLSERARQIAGELADPTEWDDEPTGVVHIKNQVMRRELERLSQSS